MKLKIYQVDAFTNKIFSGNPAAVVPLDSWLSDEILQNIAMENNLSETAFFIKDGDGFGLRWFTPASEVDLCGHATLAAAYIIFNHFDYGQDDIVFASKSGDLRVKREDGKYIMDFPTITSQKVDAKDKFDWLSDLRPLEILTSKQDLMVVLSSESEIVNCKPISNSGGYRGLVITAKGDDVDFVSRCFYSELNVPEDPVTGSAHCQMAPYWSQKLGKTVLKARQLSKRGGEVDCEVRGERVILKGNAALYLVGEIHAIL